MVAVLFDTCILVDFLRGIDAARVTIDACDERPAISIVSRIELLAGAPAHAEKPTLALLARFAVLPLDEATAERTVMIRRLKRLKLPDAIILATAETHGRLLITRDERGFDSQSPSVRIPYRLTET
jgi:predicted nucleic acid-binding protein